MNQFNLQHFGTIILYKMIQSYDISIKHTKYRISSERILVKKLC